MALTVLTRQTDPHRLTTAALRGSTVAVIGFGNQGASHALNLRESGITVVVANRPDSTNGRRAADAGFSPLSIEAAVAQSDLVIVALPDELHRTVFDASIAPALQPASTIGFLHGFSLRFGGVNPPEGIGVVMVAPKGPGTTLRDRFVRGLGLPCLFAVHRESARRDAEAKGLAWAAGIGADRAAVVVTTVANEAETDLFGEQAVLCGGLMHLMLAAFETLTARGYPPELAYLECCHEVKQVADLMYERGLRGMGEAVSNTAEFGAFHAGPRIITPDARGALENLLRDIRSGEFSCRLEQDYAAGFPWFEAQRKRLAHHPVEQAGRTVREWMHAGLSAPPAPLIPEQDH